MPKTEIRSFLHQHSQTRSTAPYTDLSHAISFPTGQKIWKVQTEIYLKLVSKLHFLHCAEMHISLIHYINSSSNKNFCPMTQKMYKIQHKQHFIYALKQNIPFPKPT